MKRHLLLLFLSHFLYFTSCINEKKEEATQENKTTQQEETFQNSISSKQQKGGLTLTPVNGSESFPNAQLTLKEPLLNQVKAGKQRFKFEVENYELTKQTSDATERHCANSLKGQHIHFILNNAPYRAEYETEFDAELMEGNNVVLAFLSRSYHESIKHKNAFVFKNFPIGEQIFEFNENAPHLFYSRPKGQYEGKDAEKILIDFFLINTTLSENGNKVRLRVDDETFIINEWQGYFLEGLSKGKHSFRIELLDSTGHLIDGPFNDSGVREIELI